MFNHIQSNIPKYPIRSISECNLSIMTDFRQSVDEIQAIIHVYKYARVRRKIEGST